MNENNFPKLHNATWPGLVGKGPDSEPPIPFDTMLQLTAAAEHVVIVGVEFDPAARHAERPGHPGGSQAQNAPALFEGPLGQGGDGGFFHEKTKR